LHKIDIKIKELKSLPIPAADALENGPLETHLQLSPGTAKGGTLNSPHLKEAVSRLLG
jgi:hypothetical protein